MGTSTKESIKMKVFPKGQIVIPVSLRKRYQIEIGDQIDVVPESEGILLKPSAKEQRGKSATERLFGIFSGYASKKPEPTKADIEKATEAGFIEGWNK
jgi:AbrB family looped-hinge helix DNA binding protein